MINTIYRFRYSVSWIWIPGGRDADGSDSGVGIDRDSVFCCIPLGRKGFRMLSATVARPNIRILFFATFIPKNSFVLLRLTQL